jgi:ABC-2 type transport system permease protein
MTGLAAIFRRELAGLFVGPLAWILLTIALALNGYLYVVYLKLSDGDVDVSTRLALGDSFVFWAMLVLLPPLLTMRMISEESKSGLLEFLLTAPVSDAALVTGKFLAALCFMGLLWAAVAPSAVVASAFGPPIDWGILGGAWLGALFASGLFCAIGLFASSLTSTPIVAACAAILFSLAVVLAPMLALLTDSAWLRGAVARVDVRAHVQESFMLGVLDTAYVVFFVAWTALFLFLATRAVEARRWR